MPNLPTGTVTFLFTDVEGSTGLWEQYPDAMRSALVRHDAVIEFSVEQHRGLLVRPRGEGDSRFAVFARASDAVGAAYSIQRALVTEVWSTPKPLRVRLALHTGEADLRDGDYYGAAVNRCARLRAVAHGGQVLLSGVTAELAGAALPAGVDLRNLGRHRLKDLTEPQQVFQLVHSELPAEFAPLLSLDAHRHNLPVQATSLIGREPEVADVRRRLLEPGVRIVTLTGAGGVGKTRLALQAAAEVLEHFTDGVFVVPLAALSEAALVVPTISQTVGVREQNGASLQASLGKFLHDKSLLLVLDNFEQVLPAATPVAELLSACPLLRVLVTSRAPLRVYGEQEFSVPPLRLPIAPWPSPERLSQYDAVRLLVERARAVKPDFTVTTETGPAIAEICARLDGLPLAIELAAARIKLLPPEALLARLDQRLKLLVGGPRDRPARQQTLRSTIDWSFNLLDAGQQAVFRRLAVFVGGCTLEAAERICATKGELQVEMLDALGALVDESLLRQEAHLGAEPRFGMLETIREYALEQLEVSGDTEATRRRHVDYFIAMGEQAAPENAGAEYARWLDQLERDQDNLRAALHWCVENGDVERGLQLGGAVSRYWFLQGSLSEGREWLQALLRIVGGAVRSALRARALDGAGVLASQQGDHVAAQALHEESLAIGRELGDQARIASSLHNLGTLAQRSGDSAMARSVLEEVVAKSRAAGDRPREAYTLDALGGVLAEQGEYQAACRRYGESAAIYRDLEDKMGMASAIGRQGFAALTGGDVATAQTLCREALELARESGHKPTIAWCCLDLALVRLQQADYANARALFVESLLLRDRSGVARTRVALALQGLASVAAAMDQPERALRLFGSTAAFLTASAPGYWGPGMGLHRIWREPWEARASSALGEEAAAEALSAGSAQPIDQAIAYALDDDAVLA
jgi:predicted ATPase/class 3 adenylate cyclase